MAITDGSKLLGQALEGGYGVVVVGGKAAADVNQLEIEAAGLGLREDTGGEVL